MGHPLVSIILPTYNGNSVRIAQAIKSVISQTYSNRELIIINDASTNAIEKTILSYANKDKRIKYHKNEVNREKSYTKNKGISISQGEYVGFIDDDDVRSDKEKLIKQVDFLEKNKEYVMVGCDTIIEINEDGKDICTHNMRTNRQDIYHNLLSGNQFAQSGVLARKDSIQYTGGFPLALHLAEDYYLWLSLGIIGKMTNINSHIHYRNRAGNTSNTQKWGIFISVFLQTFIFRKHYQGFFRSMIIKFIYYFLPKKISSSLGKVYKYMIGDYKV